MTEPEKPPLPPHLMRQRSVAGNAARDLDAEVRAENRIMSSLLDALEEMKKTDADDYDRLIEIIRAFVIKKRDDLARRERLIGLK
jgi:hypothetical protein